MIAGVIGPRTVLTKRDLDLVLRRLLVPPSPDLCARVAVARRPGVFSASLLAALLESAAQSKSDPLHGVVVAGLSNIRPSFMFPRRRRPRPPKVVPAAADAVPFRTGPALESDVDSDASESYDEGDEAPQPARTETKWQWRPRAEVPGERYLPAFYDNLDFRPVMGAR
jgi:hypothetical protein